MELVVTCELLKPLLDGASSQTGFVNLKEVEATLKNLEARPGFHFSLLAFAGDKANQVGSRLQSVLYLKNGIDRYWRKTATNAISESEKQSIRAAVLQMYPEPVHSIALQLAVIVGKIARSDVPKEWPELLPALLNGAQSEDALVKHRALLLLYHALKVMSTKRLGADRRLFGEMTEQLVPFLLPYWRAQQEALASAPDEEAVSFSLQNALVTLKILRKLFIYGLRKPHENPESLAFLMSLHQECKNSLYLRRNHPALSMVLEKYAVLHVKLLTDLLEHHPFSFLAVMKDSLRFVCWLCFTPEGSSLAFQRLLIFSLNILKYVLLCPEYKSKTLGGDSEVNNAGSSPAFTAMVAKKEFFAANTVTEICKQLLFQYIPMQKDELELWDGDPEQFCCDEGGDSWKYSYRSCIESVFVTVFHEFKEWLTPLLLGLLNECSSTSPIVGCDLATILQKDAVYNAVGLAAFELFDEIDFDWWLMNGVGKELSLTSDPNYRIIRRRMVWMIGQWSGVKVSPKYRPKLYELLLPMLGPGEDLAVRITAAKSLKIVIDDFEFSSEEVQPYMEVAFNSLFSLLKQVDECDTKLTVLDVLSYLMERVGIAIRSLCDGLVLYLPQLWDSSLDHNMLRCSILGTLVIIVQGLGTVSEAIAPFVFCVIKLSVDRDNDESVYLLEDGLELWLAALQNSKFMLPQWMELTRFIPKVLEQGSENMRTMIYIVQAYLYLASDEFLTHCGNAIQSPLDDQYADLRDEGALLVLRLVDLALKLGSTHGSMSVFGSLIIRSFHAVFEGKDFPMLMSLHLSIISRMLLKFPKECNEMMAELARRMQTDENKVAGRILDVWLDEMPKVNQQDRQKLLAMGLASLLLNNSPVVNDRIYAILLHIAETLNDVMKFEAETNTYSDSLIMTDCGQQQQQQGGCAGGDEDETMYDTEHDHRRRAATARDLVHRESLSAFTQDKVSAWRTWVGEAAYGEMLANLDVETKDSLALYMML